MTSHPSRRVPFALVVCTMLWATALALPAAAQSLPSSTAGLESRLSPAQIRKAERLVQKVESGRLTPSQAAKVRELEGRPGAGAARAQGEKMLAARRDQELNPSKAGKSNSAAAGTGLRKLDDTSASAGAGLRASRSSAGGSYQPGASPLGGMGSGSSSGGGFGAPPAWAGKGR